MMHILNGLGLRLAGFQVDEKPCAVHAAGNTVARMCIYKEGESETSFLLKYQFSAVLPSNTAMPKTDLYDYVQSLTSSFIVQESCGTEGLRLRSQQIRRCRVVRHLCNCVINIAGH